MMRTVSPRLPSDVSIHRLEGEEGWGAAVHRALSFQEAYTAEKGAPRLPKDVLIELKTLSLINQMHCHQATLAGLTLWAVSRPPSLKNT